MDLSYLIDDSGVLAVPYGTPEIPPKALCDNKKLKKVIIPGTVKTIGYEAFSGCINLKEVIIDYGVNEIQDMAFKWCCSIPRISLPQSVTNIGCGPFAWCQSLKYIRISKNTRTNIQDDAFYACRARVYEYDYAEK